MKSLLQKTVAELKKIKCIQGIYLFGSQATGKVKPLSDIDICLFTEENISRRNEIEAVSFSSKKIDISLFHRLPLSIRYRVFKEGKPLYEKDKLFLHRAEVKAINEYLDFKPIIERHIKRTLG